MIAQYSGLILLAPLTILIVDDFRSRTVSLVWLIVLSALSFIVALYTNGIWQTLINIAVNIFLLFYLSIGIIIYIRIRRNRWINPLKEYIGSGDVVLLLAIAPLFDLRGYLLFLICASLFSLLWMLAAKAVCRNVRTIPLAATTGITLSATIIMETFT